MTVDVSADGLHDQLAVRHANLTRTLRHIRTNGPRSRAAIAAATGLHKTTVSSLVEELLTRRLVRELGMDHSGAAGRPGRGIALSPHIGAIGIEINVDYLAVHGSDLAGRTVYEQRTGFACAGRDVERCLDDIAEAARRALAHLAERGVTPIGVTAAVPGLIDVTRGVVVLAPNLGWHEVPIVDRLSHSLPRRLWIGVDNDANLAALAEHGSGVAAGTDDLIYLTGEVGVGAGVILGGRLLRGADGFCGEIGHMTVDPGGDVCGCGRTGCWETKVGLAALVRRVTPDAAYGLERGPLPDPQDRVAEVARRLAAGDRAARHAVTDVGTWLGFGSAILVNLFNPRAIVLGGYLAALAEHIIPAAQAALACRAVANPAARCHFVASRLGFTAAARGAAGVVLDRVIEHPTTVPVPPPVPAIRVR